MSLVNEKQFTCWYCKRTLPFIRKDKGHVTQNIGFVVSSMGQHCYDCQARFDVRQMMIEGKAIMYITAGPNNIPPAEIVNWTNSIHFLVLRQKSSKHIIGRNQTWRVDAWFTGPDGAKWHGVNIGDNQIIRCARLKKQKQPLTLVNENVYLKPFDYTKLK